MVNRKPDADLAIELTGAGPGDDVVDVGCGPGSAARRVARRGAASVVGIDPAAELFDGPRPVPATDGGTPIACLFP